MKRFDDALREAGAVLERDPLNLNALQVEGDVLERLGRKDVAISTYRRALRYRPDYGPALRALVRLTGSEAVRTPAVPDPANVPRVAAGLAEATASVQRGDYAGALRILDGIEPLAPTAVEIHQTRANAAYLMGDRALAAKALKRALEIEPDNALFKRNLARLAGKK
jgi:tetratricopeptide (TPR) repeat protein